MRSRSSQFRAAVLPVASSRGSGVASRLRPVRAARAARAAALAGPRARRPRVARGCTGKGSQNPNAQSVERQSDAEYDLARDLFEKGNPRAALDHAMKAISLNEDNDKAQYFVAVIHLSFCSTNRGLDHARVPPHRGREVRARRAQGERPSSATRRTSSVRSSSNEKRCKEAITILEPLTKDPAYVHPYFAWGNLGDAQLCDGQVDAAIVSLKNAVAEPRFCVGHHRLGLAYEKKGDLPTAEASFTNAVTADPACDELQDALVGPLPRSLAPRQRRVEERLREVPGHLGRHPDRASSASRRSAPRRRRTCRRELARHRHPPRELAQPVSPTSLALFPGCTPMTRTT